MATTWDETIARGTTVQISYPYLVNGVLTALPSFTDIRWLAKLNATDADGAAVITKTYLNGGITITGGNTILVTLNPADTAAPAITPGPGTVYVYLGLKLYLPGSPEVVFDLFEAALPSVPLLTIGQGIVQATS